MAPYLRPSLILAASLLGVFPSACALEPEVESEIVRTHANAFDWQGRSFTFDSTVSQEVRYQAAIAKQLITLGMHPALTASQADLAVRFHTSTGKGTTETYDYDSDVGDNFGLGGLSGWNDPGWGWGMGGGWDPETITTYPHRLTVQITDLRAQKHAPVFEGKLKYEGEEKSFATVGACLIQAMFDHFPGEDGKTVTVALPAKGCIESKDASKPDLHVPQDGHPSATSAHSGS